MLNWSTTASSTALPRPETRCYPDWVAGMDTDLILPPRTVCPRRGVVRPGRIREAAAR